MTIYNLLSEENKTVSNDYLAEQLRESYRRYKKYVAKNTPLWQKEGAEMRAIREEQGISQKYLGELVGVSSQTIAKMEKGKPVRSRIMLITSCKTVMKLLPPEEQLEEEQSDIDLFDGLTVQE